LIIPFSAIVESDGVSEVWVVADNKVQKRQVKVLEIKSQGGAVVQGELSEGELVVSAGVNSLKEGQEVTLLEEASASNIGGIK
ncbi:MAG: efflux RND transporter periplasmic adaptor subunit, partial [Rikenellaceae bacterium]